MKIINFINQWFSSFMQEVGYANDDEKLLLIEKAHAKQEGKPYCVEMIHKHNPTSVLFIPIHSIKTYIDMGWHIYDDEYKKQYQKIKNEEQMKKTPLIITNQ